MGTSTRAIGAHVLCASICIARDPNARSHGRARVALRRRRIAVDSVGPRVVPATGRANAGEDDETDDVTP